MTTVSNPATRARDLHRRAIVIDGHSDILIPVTDGKMNLGDRVSVPGLDWPMPPGLEGTFSKFGFSAHTQWFSCMGQYDLPRWREGGVTSQLCAIYLDDNWLRDPFRRGMEMVWGENPNLENADPANPDGGIQSSPGKSNRSASDILPSVTGMRMSLWPSMTMARR